MSIWTTKTKRSYNTMRCWGALKNLRRCRATTSYVAEQQEFGNQVVLGRDLGRSHRPQQRMGSPGPRWCTARHVS